MYKTRLEAVKGISSRGVKIFVLLKKKANDQQLCAMIEELKQELKGRENFESANELKK